MQVSLLLNTVALATGVAALMEHPSGRVGMMPGSQDEFPSIWGTTEMLNILEHPRADTYTLHQCMFGAPARKETTFLSTNCFLKEHVRDNLAHVGICPDVFANHTYQVFKERDSDGHFTTAAAKV